MDLPNLGPWGRLALLAVAVVLAALVAHRLLRSLAYRLAGFSTVLSAVVRQCDRPAQFLLPLAALQVVWQGVPDELPGLAAVQHLNGILTIATVSWLAAAAIQGVANGVVALNPSNVADNLEARRVQTQTRVLARIAIGVVLFAGVAFILMTFPRARQLGASLLASAGVAGLIVGIAARSVFSNLLAGLQIALAQPIRIDDVLIVEGEWGRVEEITSTFVVLKIWDERRLVVPLSWFIENPFQNWTRCSADLLGTVMLWVDYTLPVEPIRGEAQRVCEASPNWDRRVCAVQVTDASERCMQLRILASSASSSQNFELRCELREALIGFIQREHPQALPRMRAELDMQQTATPLA
ncbi:mechanosensitive ion channel family protein [Piscinibacter sp.]|uniref:mechanosensitive ion channel family protein n=1 Tax=Piscinibacter sp. TaxID=1903157 RepID=UPI002C93FE55|nr:mechanosensitive ion channel domain-containing protein [Albitalea sp.]HUG21127.1 mechanosensitive ion channel domain-containing protein [Albitalea sp.]